MSTHLFQALTLGLLLIVVVVLLVVVSMLGKVRAALELKSAARSPGADDETRAVDAQEIDPTSTRATFDAFEAEESKPEALTPDVEELAVTPTAEQVEATEQSMAEAEDVDSDRPFERAGRWYFRRGGELLVYEEGTGEWIPATGAAAETPSSAPASRPREDTSVQAQAEEVAAATEPAPATAVTEREPEPETAGSASEAAPVEQADDATERTPSTSFGGQPVAVVEDPGSLEDSELAPDPGGAASDFEVTEAREADALAQQAESFWKCPSCGAVNGSTASSCRMCFTPRP